jgi:spermidine/putrescine-binding protein
MRKQSVCAALALAVCLAASVAVAAKPKSNKLSFGSDFRVGSTLVKAGTYKVTYDDKTGEVTINDKTSTVARATVKVEQREKAKAGWDVVLASKGDGLALVSLAFPGDKQNLVFAGATAGSSDSGAASSAAP